MSKPNRSLDVGIHDHMIRSCSNQDIEFVIKPRTFEHKIDQPKRIIRIFLRRSRSSSEKVHNRELLDCPTVREVPGERLKSMSRIRIRVGCARGTLCARLSLSSWALQRPKHSQISISGNSACAWTSASHCCCTRPNAWRILQTVNRKERIVHDQGPRSGRLQVSEGTQYTSHTTPASLCLMRSCAAAGRVAQNSQNVWLCI
ncbi:hypothetical protein GE09DRAFT_570001 [Coniochaeta sp. 2T2.1]|nr:hypothetical protein GE09DRAFT_570001 [Coniochaeta sp. 2T2.1]